MARVHPNPFKDEVAVEFYLARGGDAAVSIYDASGRQVRQLTTRGLEQGHQRLMWDGRDEENRSVPRGVYFVEVRAGSMVTRNKIIVMKP